MNDKFNSRKWKVTIFVAVSTNVICGSIVIISMIMGQTAFMSLVPPVLLAIGAVNTLTVGAYNYVQGRIDERKASEH